MAATKLPKLPAAHNELPSYFAKHADTPMSTLMEPFREFEARLREVYAQDRTDPILEDPYINVVPVFNDNTVDIKTRARDPAAQSRQEKDKYIMALPDEKRRPNGSPAVVQSLKEFRHNFGVFSESSLVEMDWDNVVAAGSSVVNCLLPVPAEFNKNKRSLRQYYHEKFCPASDVDLFLYGLNEEEAIEKIKNIEASIRDAILAETTVVRTKNAITICSQYPTRHVQIVLRVYKSISEILTGFDIDCSGAAYDGKQVYCTPRALASYITQINPIDLSRRSPSYENRLSKYSHRNFEVYWPELDRSRVDPTIFERSFHRTLGLARLLVLERLPNTNAREEYLKKRRQERGRPDLGNRFRHRLRGNIKDHHEDEVAEWVDEDDVSNYHTFTVPYGVKFHAKKIEKLCYTKDLLLNAEWNQPKEREVYLHRHPAFFGRVQDVIGDCCGTCPTAITPEEIEVAEKESEIYVSGKVSFRIDDPGRQQIGSFNPLTENDWTEMAYVGNTARLCQAIVDCDLEHVEDWLAQEGADPNQRDYTGRTPLQLAVISSTPEIVKCLVDNGARIVARMADGRTALHLAAGRGEADMVKILLEKSAANEEIEEEKKDARLKAKAAGQDGAKDSTTADDVRSDDDEDEDEDEDDGEMIDDDEESDDGVHSIATGSFVKVKKDDEKSQAEEALPLDDNENDPDFYDVNVVAWDTNCSALHFAILGGHTEVVKLLCQEFGADILAPIVFGDGSYHSPKTAILTLVLALALPLEKATLMAETLLSLGATSSQADMNGVTAFHRYIQKGTPQLVNHLWENDKLGLKTAINHVVATGSVWNSNATNPLMSAIDRDDPILALRLLQAGANPTIDFESWLKGAKISFEKNLGNYEQNKERFRDAVEQPLLAALRSTNPEVAIELLNRGADPNVITKASQNVVKNEWTRRHQKGYAALDVLRETLARLRDYKGEKTTFMLSSDTDNTSYRYRRLDHTYVEAPKGPYGTDEFLKKFAGGTYQHWLVSSDIEQKVKYYKAELERFENEKKKNDSQEGLKEKAEAIEEAIRQLESVEKALLAKGAKTFGEQYPDIKDPSVTNEITQPEPSGPYKMEFTFLNTKDITETRRVAYISLFEAAWSGDLDKIKSLTLGRWGDQAQEPPLKLAVWDSKGNNAFSLAFLRGHYDVAKAILEIVQAQWTSKDESKTRYKMTGDEDNEYEDSYEDSEGDDESLDIYKELVSDQHTIENVGQISMQVKSETLATEMINWTAPTFSIMDGSVTSTQSRESLLYRALENNDAKQFKALVGLDMHFTSQKPESEDEASRFYTFPEDQFRNAVKLGRVELLGEVIKRAGAGIPLEHLVKKSGVEMSVKPKYYQGLTVYGKKRADWANAGRNLMAKATGSKVPPLLTAALEGSIESVEWFISDAPMRHYLEFGTSTAVKNDPRLKHLSQAPGGFDRAIVKWLGIQNDLVMHCAVMGPNNETTNQLIKYLIKIAPASLEARSEQGYTPLYVACLLGRVKFAKTLIANDADQSVKDKDANNIIHAALINGPKLHLLRQLLDLVDAGLRPHLLQQKNQLAFGGDTPTHSFLKQANELSRVNYYGFNGARLRDREIGGESKRNVKVLRLLLEYTKGQELEMLNGAGDTCLHTAVLLQLPEHMKAILEINPKLLYRENAVGRTPAEIAYDMFISQKVTHQDGIEVTGANSPDKLVGREPKSFLPKDGPECSPKEMTWVVAKEYLPKSPGEKRRLVSLNEANDVARRLGESYSWQRYYTKSTAAAEEPEVPEQTAPDEKESDIVTLEYTRMKHQAWARDAENLRVCPDCGECHEDDEESE